MATKFGGPVTLKRTQPKSFLFLIMSKAAASSGVKRGGAFTEWEEFAIISELLKR
jgi:hypothetical protein